MQPVLFCVILKHLNKVLSLSCIITREVNEECTWHGFDDDQYWA